MIEGFVCHGYRREQLAGEIYDFWVAEESQEVVFGESTGGAGDATVRLFEIRRTEPANSLFALPRYYNVEDVN